jgi:hypothetical protein
MNEPLAQLTTVSRKTGEGHLMGQTTRSHNSSRNHLEMNFRRLAMEDADRLAAREPRAKTGREPLR